MSFTCIPGVELTIVVFAYETVNFNLALGTLIVFGLVISTRLRALVVMI